MNAPDRSAGVRHDRPQAGPEHPFDGLRPRNACCPACGYVFGGIEIVRSRVRCPECGEEFVFALPERGRAKTLPRWRWRSLTAVALVFALVLGWRFAGTVGLGAGLLAWAIVAGVLGILSALRHRLLSD